MALILPLKLLKPDFFNFSNFSAMFSAVQPFSTSGFGLHDEESIRFAPNFYKITSLFQQ